MYRYTTPTITVKIRGADLANCRVWVTFSQGRLNCVTKEVTDLKEEDDGNWKFDIPLTQCETSKFQSGLPVKVQANIVDRNGFRAATNIVSSDKALRNLMDRIV